VVLGVLGTVQGCDLNLFDLDLPGGCVDAGPPPANATSTTDDFGCTGYVCNAGFSQCPGSAPCGIALLSDSQNCGVCGNTCPGGACTEGSCSPVTVLLDGLSSAGEVAVDDTFVYVAAGSAILRVPKAGGAPVTMATTGASGSSPYSDLAPNGTVSIAVDSSGLYWASDALYTTSVPGAEPTVLVASLGDGTDPIRLAGDSVYWMTDFELTDAGGGAGSANVWRVAKTGGPPELVASMAQTTFYADGNPIAAGAGRVAWGDGTEVVSMLLDGGARTRLATQLPSVGTLAADDAFLYWVPGNTTAASSSWDIVWVAGNAGQLEPESPEAGVLDVPWGGGPWRAISAGANVAHLVADSPRAVYGVQPQGPVVRIDLFSGAHTVVAGGGIIGGLALDATTLYWTRDSKLLASPLP
jgi:hypothetical protein